MKNILWKRVSRIWSIAIYNLWDNKTISNDWDWRFSSRCLQGHNFYNQVTIFFSRLFHDVCSLRIWLPFFYWTPVTVLVFTASFSHMIVQRNVPCSKTGRFYIGGRNIWDLYCRIKRRASCYVTHALSNFQFANHRG